jgi:glucokinase
MADVTPFWIGIDLGGTKMMAVLLNSDFEFLARVRKRTKPSEGPSVGLRTMAQLVRDTLAEAGIPQSRLAGIGVATPGPADLNRGVILDLPNLGWSRVPVKRELQRALGRPVVVSNDVDAGTYGEYRFGAGRGARTLIGVFLGTGIGGGCVYEGRLLRGRSSSCFEIGHLSTPTGRQLCGCGRTGCLETVAGRLAVASAAIAAAHRGDAPYLKSHYGMDLSDVRSRALAESIAGGDRAVETIVRGAASAVGQAVGDVVNLMAPDRIVLGGGMVEAMPNLFRHEILTAANRRAMPAFARTFRVAVAQLGDDATAVGAAAWAEHLLHSAPAGNAP